MALVLSTLESLASSIARAGRVAVSAYRLAPSMEDDLARAARRGAAVDVALASGPAGRYDDGLAAENRAAAERLRAAGARVRFADGAHLKAAVVDGVAWLDDRNFARRGPSNVVRDDDPRDVARVGAAIAGGEPPAADAKPAPLALDKAAAIALEARTLAPAAGDTVALASESFGFGEISRALRACRAAGEPVRLLVDRREAGTPREAVALRAMAALGVEIRTADAVDKVALRRDRAWLGSANATYAGFGTRPQSDWGETTDDAAVVAELGARYERAWSSARPYLTEASRHHRLKSAHHRDAPPPETRTDPRLRRLEL